MTNDNENTKTIKSGISILFIILVIWFLVGIVAFITSLVCFGKSGTTLDKVMGLLLAIFFGPFYFIFFAFNKSYCR